MDPTVLAALIGGVSTVLAALIGYRAATRDRGRRAQARPRAPRAEQRQPVWEAHSKGKGDIPDQR
ncbi:hypothetical protein [Streptomyces formicae]|uniref:Uncharacterized protein n=1 Tax=Streptomyces formicae TaxID=1616117 RepID=A0A291QG08_9ACTN|nr:hypothetical protein [Streptomyces formicae]ATL30639.1 hypothetical protein KY5_5621c [Streptomyces formicae]